MGDGRRALEQAAVSSSAIPLLPWSFPSACRSARPIRWFCLRYWRPCPGRYGTTTTWAGHPAAAARSGSRGTGE